MVLCEVAAHVLGDNVVLTWLALTVGGGLFAMSLSTVMFMKLYWAPTYDAWRYKSNPKFPRPSQIRMEVLQTLKCIALSTICPTIALWLINNGRSHAFCGWGDHGLAWHVGSFLLMWLLSDLFEWGYHGLGHSVPFLWKQHKNHHIFYNPSPFSVVADEAYDQLVRSAPMLVFPLLMPTNMDVLWGMFLVAFYTHGVYMHGGYELNWPDAHHPWLNTSYQHYLHHSVGAVGKPAHTGFWLKCWDQLVGADLTAELVREGKCGCAKHCRERGERTLEAFQAVEKPDYGCLLTLKYWLKGDGKKAHA